MKALTVFALVCALMALTGAAEKSHLVTSCCSGWSEFKGRCFHYVSTAMTWATAEKHCLSMGGNLASVHSLQEYQEIQKLIKIAGKNDQEAWIGGSDAQEEKHFFWSDGKPFQFSNWCHGEPNNGKSHLQHCIQINHKAEKCWDDDECRGKKPSVCAKDI